jgi:glycosyltransferase involved in cell wall biosynthesis
MRFLVLIPAHNEEAGIDATLGSIDAIEYPGQLVSVVVVADNCTDDTAARAIAAGAEAMTRIDSERRGKGYALGWALERTR